MRAARRQGVLGVVRYGTRPSSRVRACTPPVQHRLRGDYHLASTHIEADKGIMDALVHPKKKRGREGERKQLPGSQCWRRRFGAYFMLTMPGSSRNHPSSWGR